MSDSDIQTLLREAIAVAKTLQTEQSPPKTTSRIRRLGSVTQNKRQEARQLLLRVIELDEGNIPAWLWLSTVVDDLGEKQTCLENVLVIDPHNKPATVGLARLKEQIIAAKMASIQNNSPQTVALEKKDTTAPDQTTESPEPVQTTPASPEQPQCPYCGQLISGVAANCPHCSVPLIIDCPACSHRFDIERVACPQCYYRVGDCQEGLDYLVRLAKAHWKHDQPQKALAMWQVVKNLEPDYPHIDLRLGKLQAAVGRTDTAISLLQEAMKQERDEVAASLELGQIFQQLHRWDEAGILFRKVLKLAPEQASSHFAMGWFFMEQGQIGDALSYLRQAVKLDPQHAQAWLRLAQLYDHLKNRKQAAQAYRQATQLLSRSSLDNLKAQQRLTTLQPDLPVKLGNNNGELLRQMSGPLLICLLAALMDAGLRPWWLSVANWLALFLAVPGAFLWVSGHSLPRNPLMLQLLDEQELTSSTVRLALALTGALFWLLALLLILMPIGQTFPEVPLL